MPLENKSRSWCAMNGSPFNSIMALGMVAVIGRRRVANPPLRMATGSVQPLMTELQPWFLGSRNGNELREARCPHRTPQPGLVLGIEHQKPTNFRRSPDSSAYLH